MVRLRCLEYFLGVLLHLFVLVSCKYNIGAGRYDITDIGFGRTGMMGYGMFHQRVSGIHMRLYARAFIISNDSGSLVFVSSDICFISQSIKQTVVKKLIEIYGTDVYNEKNVMLSSTHTHSGPGGYAWHPLYDITSLGFHEGNFNKIVNGIVNAIRTAHSNLSPGSIFLGVDRILNISINRSPLAYTANPKEERDNYEYDTDKDLTVLKFVQSDGKEIGVISWFAVHGTSINNTNELISGDNKGYASYLFEKYKDPDYLTGSGPFVAAFPQSNEGDVTPNINGSFCTNGEKCEPIHSSCNGRNDGCHGVGPGKTDFQSCNIVGKTQFTKTLEVYNKAEIELNGPLGFIHIWQDMENTVVPPIWTGLKENVTTCIGSLGDSFAAGTTDGPGMFNFVQGTNSSSTNPYWNWLFSYIIHSPSADTVKCQNPKPILICSGAVKFPIKWTQGIMPLQIFRIGQLWILAVPGEFTTMSGRRLRNSVREYLEKAGVWQNDSHIIISGLSNSYSHYITTPQEYKFQRYEGASTLFGPNTLPAYQMLYSDLAFRLAKNMQPPPSAKPEVLNSLSYNLIPPIIYDFVPRNVEFGQVYQNPNFLYRVGDTVEVIFWTSSPKGVNDYNYLYVERLMDSSKWVPISSDGDWDTKCRWERSGIYLRAVITWDIPLDAETGIYRITHFGRYRYINADYSTPFNGSSNPFNVIRFK